MQPPSLQYWKSFITRPQVDCLCPWICKWIEVWYRMLLHNMLLQRIFFKYVFRACLAFIRERKVERIMKNQCSEIQQKVLGWYRPQDVGFTHEGIKGDLQVCLCVCVCLLQPCWHVALMSSSAVTVPAYTAPSSVTRSMTARTTATNLAVSMVGTPHRCLHVCLPESVLLSACSPVFFLYASVCLNLSSYLSFCLLIWLSLSLILLHVSLCEILLKKKGNLQWSLTTLRRPLWFALCGWPKPSSCIYCRELKIKVTYHSTFYNPLLFARLLYVCCH